MFSRKAFSMIEVMCAICIFALAVLPLIWLSSSQTKTAYSASKHLMAGQLAASYMDNLLKRPYDELKKTNITNNKVLDSLPNDYENMFDLQKLIEDLKEEDSESSNHTAEENMKASFKHFKYSITIKKDTNKNVAWITVEVSYRVVEGKEEPRQSVILSALKYGEKNG